MVVQLLEHLVDHLVVCQVVHQVVHWVLQVPNFFLSVHCRYAKTKQLDAIKGII